MYSFLTSLHVNVIESGNVELQTSICNIVTCMHLTSIPILTNWYKNTETLALDLIFVTLIMIRFMVGVSQVSDVAPGPFVYFSWSSSDSPLH